MGLDVPGVVPAFWARRGTPFAPLGPGGPVPQFQRYYEVLRLPAVRLAALRFLRPAIPSLRPRFVPDGPGREAADRPGVGKPGPGRHSRWRRRGLPSSRGTLVSIRPVLRPRCDRTGSLGPCVACPARPPRLTKARAHHDRFRGSIAGRLISLSTLRRGSHPPTTQDSLPAAGPALPDGIGYP